MALPKRSKAEICEIAKRFKDSCATAGLLDDDGTVDIKRVLEDLHLVSDGWSFEPVERGELRKGYVGLALPERKVIQLLNNVYEGLCQEEKHHIFTAAHEFGHMLMHHDVELARTEPVFDSVSISEAVEEEADEFARQLLGYDSPAHEHAFQEVVKLINKFVKKPFTLVIKKKALAVRETLRRPWDGE